MPVRKPARRRGSGDFPSLKLGRMVAYESRIERDYIYLLEFDPEVVSFEEQPIRIEYKIEKKTHRYTPDFHVIKTNGDHILIECKAEDFVDTEENQRKFVMAKEWCVSRNWEFKVLTGEEMRAGYRLQNIKRLWQFARYQIFPLTKARIYAALSAEQPLTLSELMLQVVPDNPDSAQIPILYMIFHHELFTLIDEAEIADSSPIYLSQKGAGL